MEGKQTAVDWLIGEFKKQGFLYDLDIEAAKQMEKEQIINAAYHGVDYEHSSFDNAEDYYKETYGR